MDGYRKQAYILLCLFYALLGAASCKDNRSEWIHYTEGHSILDLEYINDTLGITLKDIRISEISRDSFRVKVYMLQERKDAYGPKNRFFMHFYPNYSSEKAKSFIALGTRKLRIKDETLIFERDFKTSTYWYPYVRYGLLDENGKRLFSLHLDSVKINNKN